MQTPDELSIQVEQTLNALIPELKKQIETELREQFEYQYQMSLKTEISKIQAQAKQDIEERVETIQQESMQYLINKVKPISEEEYKMKITAEIQDRFEEEFEQDKQKLFKQLSQEMKKCQPIKKLEQKFRDKFYKENQQYYESEKNKKIQLMRLNMQKKYEQEWQDQKQDLTNKFHAKLCQEQQLLESKKQEYALEIEKEKEKLNKIDQQKKKFRETKANQESDYCQLIQALQEKIETMKQQISNEEIAIQKLKSRKQISEKKKSSEPQLVEMNSPYEKSMKNQIKLETFDEELQNQEMFNLIDINSPPKLLNSDDEEQEDRHVRVVFEDQKKQSSPKCYSSNKENSMKKGNSQNNQSIIGKLEQICQERLNMDSKRTVTKQTTKGSSDFQNTRKMSKEKDDYEKMFKIRKEDNNQTKEIKLLRENLQKKTIEDLEMEEFYFQQIAYLRMKKLKNLENLIEFWSKGHMSFGERISLMQQCIDEENPDEYLNELCEEQGEIFERGYQLIEKLQQRQCFRAEIIKEDFTVEKNKRIFFALKNITKELQELYQCYKNDYGCKFEWREIDLEDILKIDKFEQSLIQKEEMKEQVRKKIEKKFN